MKFKMFCARGQRELEKAVNAWLAENDRKITIEQVQLTTILQEDDVSYRLEHTLIVFFIEHREL